MRSAHFAFASLLGGVLLSSCVTTKEEGRQLRSDVEHMREQVSALERTNEADRRGLEKKLKKMSRRVRDLEGTLQSLRQADADGSVQMEKVIAEVQTLRGDIEDARFQLGETKKTVKDILERPPVDVAAAAVAPTVEPTTKTQVGGEDVPEDAEAHFTLAKSLTDAGRADTGKLEDALAAWDLFIERHKSDKRFVEANYERGQTLFLMGNAASKDSRERHYRKAILAYQKVLESNKKKNVSAAMYQIGLSFEKLGYYDNAVVFYETLVKEHSRSKEVKNAKKRLRAARKLSRAQKKKR